MPTESLEEIFDFAVDAAWQAGRLTLQHFQTGVAVEEKADASPVTIADKGAETLLREMIGVRFPEDGIVGEEHADKEGKTGRRWILDPIDGTKSFVHGVPLYGVMVGVEIDGLPTIGVVNFPALNEMLSGAKGLGAWWNGRRARVSGVTDMANATLIITDYVQLYGKDEAVKRLCGAAKLVRGWGDCYGYALVATGRAEVVLDPRMNVWDCAALAPIMEEAGGTFTTWDGQATIWADEAVGTNGLLFDDVMAIIQG